MTDTSGAQRIAREGTLNRKQIYALKQFGNFTDKKFRYPFLCGDSSVRASTCFALKRRGMLEAHTEMWDWTQFRITAAGREYLKRGDL